MTLEDREAIRELLSAYCRHVDRGEADKWADLYTDDGSFVAERGSFGLGDGPVVGRTALRQMASRFRADGLHFSANQAIAVDGDEATVTSYVLVLEGEEDPKVRMGGCYYDRLRKVGGSWRFESRRLVTRMQRPLT